MSQYDVKPDDDTIRLLRYLKLAIANATSIERPMRDVFEWVTRRGPDGYAAAGAHFITKVQKIRPDRAAVSACIRDLLVSVREAYGNGVFRAQVVTHAIPFLNALVRGAPDLLLEWAEDMAEADEPLAMVSGALLGPTFDQRKACQGDPSFWDKATASERFPMRIFSAPCLWEDGAILSSNRRCVIGAIISFASDPTVVRIAVHVREHATRKMVQRFVEAKGKYCDVETAADDDERRTMLQDILGSVDANAARRALVADAFGLTEERSGEEEAS